MSGARRVAFIAAVAAVVWYACVLIFWALQPLSDNIPVGVDYTLKTPAAVSVSVDCNGLFDSAAKDDSPLPALKTQPKGSPPLGYQRTACGVVHRQARTVFALDTVVVVALVLGVAWFAWWRPRSSSRRHAMADLREAGVGVA